MTEQLSFVMTRRINQLLLAIFLACVTQATIADDDYGNVRKLVESGTILSLEQVLDHLDSKAEGKILEVEFEWEDGRYIYEIEILDDSGLVREIEVDAVSGEILEIELEE
jgi:uncharacterized membrane protein YkoI